MKSCTEIKLHYFSDRVVPKPVDYLFDSSAPQHQLLHGGRDDPAISDLESLG